MKRSAIACALLFMSGTASAVVRTDRPRMFLGNGSSKGTTVADFKKRCTGGDPAYTRCAGSLTAGGGLYPAINDAAGYVVSGTAARCTQAYTTLQSVAADAAGQPDAHSFISNNGRSMVQLAVVRDWCDPVLTAPQKAWIEAKMTAWADWMASGMGGYGLDVFHDDMNNVWSSVALAGLALTGTAEDAKAKTYLQKADDQWKKIIFPALAYEGDFWHEGMTYVQPTLGGAIFYATAWSIATDEDIYAWAKTNANDLYEGYIRMHAYLTRPDYKYAYFGDTSDNKQSIELFSRQLIDMMTQGTQSPIGQAFSLDIKQYSQPYYDYSGADFYLAALFYDASKDGSATPRATLPTSRWLGRASADTAVMRSGWGPDDTFVFVSCGDYFGAHQHIEAGSFQMFKKAILTTSSGYYDSFDTDHWANYYSQHSVHANTLTITEPTELFPTSLSIGNPSKNVNDGGQRPLRRDKNGAAFPNPDLAAYQSHKTSAPYVDTADIKTFALSKCHSYVACDATGAYSTASRPMNGNVAKVNEVSRQFVFLPPDVLVIFDRVESTNASYKKAFLLQSPPTPQTSGNVYTLTNGAGKLFAHTLLPTQSTASVVTNFTVAGTPHPPSVAGNESFGTRIEVSPQGANTRDVFLHVLTVGDTDAKSTVTETANEATVDIDAKQGKYTLLFPKNGKLTGHLVAKDTNGATLCDEDLDAQGQTPDGGVITPPGDGGSLGDGGTTTTTSGGCSCQSSSGNAATAGLFAIFLALFRRSRRRHP